MRDGIAPGGLTPIDGELFTFRDGHPRLIGSRCARCGVVTFPSQPSCPQCASVEVTGHLLGSHGVLWSWTIQCFPPKSPPYAVADPDAFQPFGVGYVELPDGLRVQARLTEADPARLRIGLPMELTVIPVPGLEPGVVTYAFRPVTGEGGG